MVPVVIAHRGSSSSLAEHTLAAYEQAIGEGADALECDVRLTADGHLVCVHDRRLERTSTGRGPVSTRTLAQLQREDFGAWKFGPPDDDPVFEDDSHRRVLTLERLLELVTSAGRDHVGLAIETKHPTRYAGLVEEQVVALLRRFGLVVPRAHSGARTEEHRDRIWVMSFSEVAIRRMRTLAPGVPTVYLMARIPLRFRGGETPFGAPIAGPSIAVLRAHPRFVQRAHEAGRRVAVWTVDERADVELCRDRGVDAVITNRPAFVADLLGTRPSAGPPREG